MRLTLCAVLGLLLATASGASAAGAPTYPYPARQVAKPLAGLCFADFGRTPRPCASKRQAGVR